MQTKTTVGIDISAKKVDVVILSNGKIHNSKSFEQSPQAHLLLAKYLSKYHPARVVMEATGTYYLDLALALDHAGLLVSVINPIQFHHFMKMKMDHIKNDAMDAANLAHYGAVMQPDLWQAPSIQSQHLCSMGRYISRLVADNAKAKNRLHALEATRTTPEVVLRDLRDQIELNVQRIERLRQAAIEVLETVPELHQAFNNMCAAKGIAEVSALSLLSELSVLPRFLKTKQVSRYAGLDVIQCQSGSSVLKQGRISKAGNVHLRIALYYPVMSATKSDKVTSAYYQHLQELGKKKKQALTAIMRKYLTGIWHCYLNNEVFDSSKLFDLKQLKIA